VKREAMQNAAPLDIDRALERGQPHSRAL
jgi:hypothetical protein